MTEIKFRAVAVKTGQFVYGDLHINETKSPHIHTNENLGEHFKVAYKIYPETIGQYTGLKDKNGKEIYDGDIVKNGPWKNDIHVVTPLDQGSFGTKDIRGHNFIISVLNSGCQVIGNIHENADLLQAK